MPGTRLRLAEAAALALVVGAALVVRVGTVPRQPLWVDEVFSLAIASGHSLEHPASEADPARGDFVEPPGPVPAAQFARLLQPESPPAGAGRILRAALLSDTNPPLYYLALSSWMRAFGGGDWAARFFSVAASLGALLLVVTVARHAGGRAATLPAAALFALSPLAVYYSTEARMYALQWLWVAATLSLALRLRVHATATWAWLAFAAAGACGLLTHYFFAPVWLAACGCLLAWPGRARRRAVVGALVAAVLAAAPWYARLPESLGRWRVTADWLRVAPADYHPLLTPLGLPWSLLSVRAAWGVPLALDVLNGVVVLVVLAVAARRLGRRLVSRPRRLLWTVAAAGVATPIALDAALGTHGSAHPRYALAALIPLLVLIAVALAALRPRARAFAAALLLALALAGDWRVARASARNAQAYWPLAIHLARAAPPSDLVIVHSIPSGVCAVARYGEGPRLGPLRAPVLSWVARLGNRRVPDDIERAVRGRRRVHLVLLHTLGDPAPERDWLLRQGRQVASRWFEGIQVLEFAPRVGSRFP